MTIPNVEFGDVVITFDSPIDRNKYDLGSLRLECEGRSFILDVVESYTNDEEDEITAVVEVDLDTFPVGEDTSYDLTELDLQNPNLKATLYIGSEYEEDPEYMTLFVKLGGENGMTKAINVEVD